MSILQTILGVLTVGVVTACGMELILRFRAKIIMARAEKKRAKDRREALKGAIENWIAAGEDAEDVAKQFNISLAEAVELTEELMREGRITEDDEDD